MGSTNNISVLQLKTHVGKNNQFFKKQLDKTEIIKTIFTQVLMIIQNTT